MKPLERVPPEYGSLEGMESVSDSDDGPPSDASGSRFTRRRVLAGAGTLGAVGVGGAVGLNWLAGDDTCEEWPDQPETFPEVAVVDDEPTTTDLEPIADADEVAIYVHGWNGRQVSTNQALEFERALADADYDEPVLSVAWPADSSIYWRAEGRTSTAGERLAAWLESADAVAETTIRLVGHSLGGRVALETLLHLEDRTLETVALLGTAADDDDVCQNGRFGSAIGSHAEAVYNYHSVNDEAVCRGYDLQSLSSGLGCGGSDCTGGLLDDPSVVPETYTDRDVTDTVAEHCAYQRHERGCVPQLVDDFG